MAVGGHCAEGGSRQVALGGGYGAEPLEEVGLGLRELHERLGRGLFDERGWG